MTNIRSVEEQPEQYAADPLAPTAPPSYAPSADASAVMHEFGSSRTGVDTQGISNRDPLHEMQGGKAASVFREMRYNDAIIGALIMGVKMVVRSVQWQPQPPSEFDEDDAEAERYRQFLKEAMADLSDDTWATMIDTSLDAVVYGWEAMEWTMKQRFGPQPWSEDPGALPSSRYDDGLIGWHRIAHRDQVGLYRWNIDAHGRVLGMWHRTDLVHEAVYIPRWKLVLFRPDAGGGHPEGYSWLRNAVRAWRFKKNHEWLEAVAAERGGIGLPVVRMPMGANVQAGSQDLSRAQNLVRNVRADAYAGVVLPPPMGEGEHQAWGFALEAPASAVKVDFDVVIRRFSSEMTTSILAQFLNLGMSTVGAYALSRDQRDLWHLALSGLVQMWAETMQRELVEPLYECNEDAFPDRTRWAKLVPTDIAQHDIEKLQMFLSSMIDRGLIIPDGDDRNRVRDIIGWPKESKETAGKAQAAEEASQQMQDAALQAAQNPQPTVVAAPAAKSDAAVKASETLEAETTIGKPVSMWDAEDWLQWMQRTEGGE